MWNGLIGSQIRRTNRNLLLLNSLLIGFVVLLLGANWRYIYSSVKGPYRMDRDALTGVKDSTNLTRYLVRTKGDKDLGPLFSEITQRKNKYSGKVESQTTDAYFVVVTFGERLLLVKSSARDPGVELTGFLEPMPSDVFATLGRQLVKHNANEMRERFLPFMLDAKGTTTGAWILLAFGLPALLLGLLNVKKVIERAANPEAHPLARRFLAVGAPASVAAAIDADLADRPAGCGPLFIGKRWVLNPGWLDVDAVHAHDLLWVYRKVTQNYMNGIPTTKDYAVVVRGRNGAHIEVKCSEAVQERVIQVMAERFPWLVMGYSDELDGLWKNQQAQFVAAVEERRRQHGDPDTANATKEAARAEGGPAPVRAPAAQPATSEPGVHAEPVVLDPSHATCKFCAGMLLSRPIVVCPQCQTPHHAECWEANASKCTVYGCKASIS